jgi:hypothetical protein
MIRPCYILLLVILFCSGIQSKANAQTVVHDSVRMQNDTIFQADSAIVDGEKYRAVVVFDDQRQKNAFYIKNGKGQIVFIENDYVTYVYFVDFDGDGYKDVLLERRGVDSGTQDLLLYDHKTRKFIMVGNCSNAIRVKHTKYFYSYEDCCMGRNWDSDLFFISNFKIVNLAHIKYRDGYGLKFYKSRNEKNILKERWNVRINGDTPIASGRHIEFDLGDYWTKNYTKYVRK